jgi:hypothetical protein
MLIKEIYQQSKKNDFNIKLVKPLYFKLIFVTYVEYQIIKNEKLK